MNETDVKNIIGKRIEKYFLFKEGCDNEHHIVLDDGSEIIFSHEESEGNLYHMFPVGEDI